MANRLSSMSISSTLISFHGVLVQSSILAWCTKDNRSMIFFDKNKQTKNILKCVCYGEVVKYLDEDDHVPDCLDQYDVRATLAQLLVVWETDLEQSSCVLQLLHVGFYRCNRSIGLRGQRPLKMLSAKTGLTFKVFLCSPDTLASACLPSLTLSMSRYGSSRFILKIGSRRKFSLNSCCLT